MFEIRGGNIFHVSAERVDFCANLRSEADGGEDGEGARRKLDCITQGKVD
jgi:hypothetical protein